VADEDFRRWHDRFFGGKRVGVDKMTAAFREAARNTTIRSRRVEERFGALAGAGAGAAEGGLVGVHIRFSDKVVRFKQYRGPNSKMAATQELAEATFASVKAYLGEEMVRRRGHTRFFVGSDDPARFDEAAAFITGLGGEVVNARRRPRQSAAAAAGGELRSEEYVVDDPNATAVDDFLMLSRCYPVLQAAKYSTFSMAASLAGGSTLLNFCREPLSDNLLCAVPHSLPCLGCEPFVCVCCVAIRPSCPPLPLPAGTTGRQLSTSACPTWARDVQWPPDTGNHVNPSDTVA